MRFFCIFGFFLLFVLIAFPHLHLFECPKKNILFYIRSFTMVSDECSSVFFIVYMMGIRMYVQFWLNFAIVFGASYQTNFRMNKKKKVKFYLPISFALFLIHLLWLQQKKTDHFSLKRFWNCY